MRCAISYHLYNLKNVKSTHGGVLLLVKLQAFAISKSNTPLWMFSRFLNCTNGTKSRKASHFHLFELLYATVRGLTAKRGILTLFILS